MCENYKYHHKPELKIGKNKIKIKNNKKTLKKYGGKIKINIFVMKK